jgi:hypothetical protein
MSKITSFDSSNNDIKRDPTQGSLYNLFQKNIVYSTDISLGLYIIPKEYEMRLDKISTYLYGSPNYIEELMLINDIINPYSVKEGQSIWFCSSDDFVKLYTKDDMLTHDAVRKQMIQSSQPYRDREKALSSSDQNLPPTIKPTNLQQIKVTKDNKVKIINSFE